MRKKIKRDYWLKLKVFKVKFKSKISQLSLKLQMSLLVQEDYPTFLVLEKFN